jgi:hypothetical protein
MPLASEPWARAASALTFRLVFLSLLALLHPYPCIVAPANTPGRPAITPMITKLRPGSMQAATPSRYTTEDDRVSFATEQDSQDGAVQYEEHGSPGMLLQEQSIDDGWDEADDIEQDLYDLERELEEANEARAVAEQVGSLDIFHSSASV